MLRVLLVDDEIAALKSLEHLLKACCPNVEVVATARSGSEAVEMVSLHNPDLVFLDVEMPKGNGFDFLEQSPNLNFDVVFVTAYNQYAIRAFKYSAIDYILKPVDIDELVAAVDKVQEQRGTKRNSHSRYNALFDNLKEIIPQKIIYSEGDSFRSINLSGVLTVSTDNNSHNFLMESGEEIRIPEENLNFDAIEDSSSFVEIGGQIWLNLMKIKRIDRSGQGVAVMSTGMLIPLEGNAKDILTNALTHYNQDT